MLWNKDDMALSVTFTIEMVATIAALIYAFM